MVKIIKGTYGYWNGHSVELKTEKDGPFEMEPEKEQRLVNKGVAVYVDAPEVEEVAEGVIDNNDDFSVDGEVIGHVEDDNIVITDEEVIEETVEDIKAELSEMSLEELKAEGEKYGIKYKVGTKKADFVELIFNAMATEELPEAEAEEVEAEEEELPEADPGDAIV